MQEGLEEHWGDTLVLPPEDSSWQVEFAKVSMNSANEEEVRPRKFVSCLQNSSLEWEASRRQ